MLSDHKSGNLLDLFGSLDVQPTLEGRAMLPGPSRTNARQAFGRPATGSSVMLRHVH